MNFDIPVIYDTDYIDFINSNSNYIHSIYFSLPTGKSSDARIISRLFEIDVFNAFLNNIPKHIKRYVTLNGRYTPIDLYSNENIKTTIQNLKKLYLSNNLNGIIFLDCYFLLLLSEEDPNFLKEIEAIPSINCFIDSIEKFYSYINYIKKTNFKHPSKIILDRSLNRNIKKLSSICEEIKKYDSNLKIEILLNEGCLYQCPFKINHDICISLVNDKTVGGLIYLNNKLNNNDFEFQSLNQKYGCLNYLTLNPEDILKTPFIRPEDIKYYEFIDIFKLCGKVRHFDFLQECFIAYRTGSYSKNLLDLLDSLSVFNEKYYIFNDQFPKTFFEQVNNCDKNCNSCNYCSRVFKKVSQILF